MANPNVRLRIQDPGLGIVPASAGRTQAKLGVANGGTPNTVYSAGSPAAARAILKGGPLLESVLHVLKKAGGPVHFVPLDPVSYGTVTGGFSLVGSGSGTVTGSLGPDEVVRVKIVLGGSRGTATFQVAFGAGSAGYGAAVVTAATYKLPNKRFSTLAFNTGTYVANDVYTLNTDGTVTRTGSGTATLLDASTHSPVDFYDIRVLISTAGALGAGAFQYSLNGGGSYSASLLIPASGKYIIPGTGIVLTFAGTFTEADVYTGVTTPPGYTLTEANAGMTALLANSASWGFLHMVGKPANAAAAAAMAAAVGTVMDTAEAAFRYVFGIVECPQEEGDAAVQSAFASFVHARVGVVCTDVALTSALTLRTERRSLAWAYTAALSATKLSIHPGETVASNGAGRLQGVQDIYRDEDATPALDPSRFVTARTIRDLPGFFVTRGRMMAAPGSDFEQVMNRRVMDRACGVLRIALLDFVNSSVRIDKSTGHILERDAQTIDRLGTAKLEQALLDEDEVSAVVVSCSRTDDLLTGADLNVDASIVPKGYTENIDGTIGFQNPALAAAAA